MLEINRSLIAPRVPETHKGDYGTAVLIGGSRGMSGAISLAGKAAVRAGSGLVRLLVPDPCLDTVASFAPEYMSVPLKSDRKGRIALDAFPEILTHLKTATAIAIGPGLGRSLGLDALAVRICLNTETPMVIDADALNALAERKITAFGPNRILTPHPGEFARLRGAMTPSDEQGRISAAMEFAERTACVLVLKGHRTVITDGKLFALNTNGNPGMATGGSGDVLTGLITGILAGKSGKISLFDAARLGVYLHGAAGDAAAALCGEESLSAGAICDAIRIDSLLEA